MKQVLINLYSVDELKTLFPDGFQTAFERFRDERSGKPYSWSHEVSKTMERFLKLFDAQYTYWDTFSYDRFNYTYSDVILENEDENEEELTVYSFDELKGTALKRYFEQQFTKEELNLFKDYGNCPLTGVCFDHEPLRIIHEYLRGNKPDDSLADLIDEGLNLLLDEVEADINYLESEECFIEMARDNENYFTEEGALFN